MMDRLTYKSAKGAVSSIYAEDFVLDMDEETYEGYQKILGKLAHYEDLEEAGRLIELPCAVGEIIEALEKRIPIRPIMRIEEKGFNKGRIYPHCPTCDTMPVPHPNVSYCDKCGQAIDWSEL